MQTFAYIKQGRKDAEAVQKILGLPDDRWSDVKVSFGMDELGTAQVTFLLTGEQLKQLADVAFKQVADSVMKEDGR